MENGKWNHKKQQPRNNAEQLRLPWPDVCGYQMVTTILARSFTQFKVYRACNSLCGNLLATRRNITGFCHSSMEYSNIMVWPDGDCRSWRHLKATWSSMSASLLSVQSNLRRNCIRIFGRLISSNAQGLLQQRTWKYTVSITYWQ